MGKKLCVDFIRYLHQGFMFLLGQVHTKKVFVVDIDANLQQFHNKICICYMQILLRTVLWIHCRFTTDFTTIHCRD